MSNPGRNAKILLLILLVAFVVYIWPKLPFNEKELRFPDIIKSPDVNSTVVVGKPFVLTLNESKLGTADSIVIKLNEKRVKSLSGTYMFELDTKTLPLGFHKANVTVHRDAKMKEVEIPFIVVSDITPVPVTYTKLSTITHDHKTYTQGLEFADGILYESGGQYGQSKIRKVNAKTGVVIKNVDLSAELFTEGLTILNDKLYQITYKEGICFIYDMSLNLLKKTNFRSTTGEGWGLCNDGKSLILSDGSNKLTFLNPETLAIEKTISVYAAEKEVTYLNELEFVEGYIYANIYTTNQIAKIDASNGKVISVTDFEALKNENKDGEVFNGIAYNPATKTFLITGKYWKNMYEIRFN